jgi:hypothetical protein
MGLVRRPRTLGGYGNQLRRTAAVLALTAGTGHASQRPAIDSGLEMIESPPWLIDKDTGEVWLRLVPFHLQRLHGDWPAEIDMTDEATRIGLPFPLLPNADLVDLKLRPGMTPNDIGPAAGFEANSSLGKSSWRRWAAYARTTFGWCAWPTPFFTDGRLTSVQFDRQGSDEGQNFRSMEEALILDLGNPNNCKSIKSRWPFKAPSAVHEQRREWEFVWGNVTLGFEPRDWMAQLSVGWHRMG